MHLSDQVLANDEAKKNPITSSKLPPRQFEPPKLVLPKKEPIQDEANQLKKHSVVLNRFVAWIIGCAQLAEKDSLTIAPIWESLRKASAWNNKGHDA